MSGDSPYLGLRPFTAGDADRFFGRRRWTDILVANAVASRLTVLYAESGVGKTSLLRAGLEHDLLERNDGLDNGEPKNVVMVFRRWQEGGLKPLLAQIAKATPRAPAEAASDRPGAPELLLALRRCAAVNGARVVLVLDQFEEYLLYHGDDNSAHSVPRQLASVLDDDELPVTIVIALREDALPKLDLVKRAIPHLFDNTLRLERIGVADAEEAITGPIDRYNELHANNGDRVTIKWDLVEALLREVTLGRGDDGGDSGGLTLRQRPVTGKEVELAYLSLVLERLWEEASADGIRTLDVKLLERFSGGAREIVNEHVLRAVEQLSESDRQVAVEAFRYLVTPSGGKYAYGIVDLAAQIPCETAVLARVVEALSGEDARVLRPVGVAAKGNIVDGVEIYHDKLADPILAWRAQYVEERDRMRQEAERAAAARRQRNKRLLVASLVAGALALALLFGLLALTATNARDTASREKAVAGYVGLTSTAENLLSIRPDVSLLLALEAYLHTPHGSSKTLAVSSLMSALEDASMSGAIGVLHGTGGPVTSVAFSPAEPLLASASGDGTIRLWSVVGHRQVGAPLPGSRAGEFSVAFSPDGRVLAAGGEDGVVRVWNVATRRLVSAQSLHSAGIVNSVAFSPDGDKLAAASLGGAIAVWPVQHGRPSGPVLPFTDPGVRSIAFGPDSQTLAAVGTGQVLELLNLTTKATINLRVPNASQLYTVAFDPRTGELAVAGLEHTVWLVTPTTHAVRVLGTANGAIQSVAFSDSGDMLAAGGSDGKVRLWNTATDQPLGQPFSGHTGIVNSVAFGPSGMLASASADRTIRLWHPSPHTFGQALDSGTGWSPEGRLDAVAVDPSGDTVASGTDGRNAGTIQLWNASGRPLLQIRTGDSGVRGLAFSPDGKLLASASQGGKVQLWQASSGTAYRTAFAQAGDPEFDVAFSPGRQKLLAFVDNAGNLRLLNLATGRIRSIRASPVKVFTVAFSPNGKLVATGGDDRVIRIWQVATGHLLHTLIGHTDAVFTVAFSPNGRLLASGSGDATVRLWNVASGSPVGPVLTGHSNWVRSVAFSHDGTMLASGSADGTVRLWDVADPAHASPIGQALPAQNFVDGVVFSPRGDTLASVGHDGATRLWSPIWPLAEATPSVIRSLRTWVCGLVGTGLTPGEQKVYAPGLPYHNPCH